MLVRYWYQGERGSEGGELADYSALMLLELKAQNSKVIKVNKINR